MITSTFLLKINNYLELYKKNLLHGLFLIELVENELDKIDNDKDVDLVSKQAIKSFLEENEMYEPDSVIRENENYLTGDDKLIYDVIKLQNIILNANATINNIPKSITDELNIKDVFMSYINLYKSSKLELDDFVLILWIFLYKYININDFKLDPKLYHALLQIKKLQDSKSYADLTDNEKEFIRNIIEKELNN